MRKALPAAMLVLAGLVPQTGRAATTVPVFMSNFRFCNTPVCAFNEDTRIARGDTVIWVFADPACVALHAVGCAHTATKVGGGFNSGAMPGAPGTFGGTNPKMTFQTTFNTAGTFDYVCSFHTTTPLGGPMRARIIVT